MKWLSLNTLNVASGVRISSGPVYIFQHNNFLPNNLHPGMNDFRKALIKYCHPYLYPSIDEITLPHLSSNASVSTTYIASISTQKRTKDVKCRRWFTQGLQYFFPSHFSFCYRQW